MASSSASCVLVVLGVYLKVALGVSAYGANFRSLGANNDTFILQRRIQMMAWMGSHQDSTPVQGYMQGYMEGTMNLVERYLRLFG